MIGRPAISTREMIGSSIVRGRLMRIFEIASFTSLTARSWLISSRNSMVVVEMPSVMVERTCFTPFTPATESSTHFVTWVCNSEGAAPDWVIVTATIGMSMFGKRVIGSDRKVTSPSTISTRNSTMEGSGLRIAQAETLRRIVRPQRAATEAASTARTRSPSRRKLPARATTRSPAATPSRISVNPSAERPGTTIRASTRPSFTTSRLARPSAA